MATAKFLAETWLASSPVLQSWKGPGHPLKLESSELKGEAEGYSCTIKAAY